MKHIVPNPLTENTKNRIRSIYTSKYALLFVFCIFSLLCNLRQPLIPLGPGLDASYNYGINQAALTHMSFGTQFIATYGPLDYLVLDALPNYALQASLVIAIYALVLGAGVYLFIESFRLHARTVVKLALGLMAIYVFSIGSTFSIELNYLSLFLLYCFIYAFSTPKRRIYLLAISAVASTFLFIKFTSGLATLGAILLLPFGRGNPLKSNIRKDLVLDYVSLIGVYVGAVLIWAKLLHIVSPIAYIKTGWYLSSGFSSAMSYQAGGTFVATVMAFLALLSLVAFFTFRLSKNNLQLNKLLFIVPSLAIIWKYAVARQDGHILRLAQIILPLLIVGLIVRLRHAKQWLPLSILMSLAVLTITFTIITAPFNKLSLNKDLYPFIKSPFQNLTSHEFSKFFQMHSERQIWQQSTNINLVRDKLPDSYTRQIGSAGVDVFPWEASIIYANKLHWQGRPSPFSFETFDPALDNLNAAFFESKAAPKYIVWHNEGGVYGIDARNVLWDEPKTLRVLLQSYRLAEHDNTFALMVKKEGATPAKPRTLYSQTIAWGQWVRVPKTGSNNSLEFLTANYTTGKRLKLEDLLLRSEGVSISLEQQDGELFTYRVVPAMLPQGYVINVVPSNWDDMMKFLEQKNIGTVKQIRFNGNTKYIEHSSNIQLQWLRLD